MEEIEEKIKSTKKIKDWLLASRGFLYMTLCGTLIYWVWSEDWRTTLNILTTQCILMLVTSWLIMGAKSVIKEYKKKLAKQ